MIKLTDINCNHNSKEDSCANFISQLEVDKPVGIFDSGIGGITVLAKAVEHLPGQKFIYFGDSANAPYGMKDAQTVANLSLDAANFLLGKGIKALVVACNTATSAAIERLRSFLDIPVIGMEPALKPAVEMQREGKIVVMATPLTLKQKKFNLLMESYSSKADILPLPCPDLVELIEAGVWKGAEIQNYLTKRFYSINIDNIINIVLGCTHYIFIKPEIEKFFDGKVIITDGNDGTARQLKKVLILKGFYDMDMQLYKRREPLVDFYFSACNQNSILELCREWMNQQINKN